MLCWLYEGILVFAAMLIGTLVFSVATQMKSGIAPMRPLLVAFLFVLGAVYFGWFWAKGQTLPMRTWRIRIVDRQGARVSQGRAVLRYVYCSLWYAPVIAVLQAANRFTLTEGSVILAGWVAIWALASRFHPQRQFWHDAMAGTSLVEA